MTVTYKEFFSDHGFKSPGFQVDENGNFTIANLNTTSSISINGNTVITQTGLGPGILSSNLTSLGTLTGLNVNSTSNVNITTTGTLTLSGNNDTILSSAALSVTATGAITLVSGSTGAIDNVAIGDTTPAVGTFTTLTATTDLYIGSQNVKALSAALAVALS